MEALSAAQPRCRAGHLGHAEPASPAGGNAPLPHPAAARAAALGLLHMYLCSLSPAGTAAVRADALHPREASASGPPPQRRASPRRCSVASPASSGRRHTEHPPRSSPSLELVAVTLCSGSQALPQQPTASPGRQGRAGLPPHPPLRVPSSGAEPQHSPRRAHRAGGPRDLEATSTQARRRRAHG